MTDEPTHDPTSDQQLFTVDAATQEKRYNEVLNYQAVKGGYQRRMTTADALNLANFARAYMSTSPEVAAGIAESQIPWDMPQLGKLITQDAKVQDGIWSKFASVNNTAAKAMVRTAFAGVDSVWDEGIGRLTRTGILAYQKRGLVRLVRTSIGFL